VCYEFYCRYSVTKSNTTWKRLYPIRVMNIHWLSFCMKGDIHVHIWEKMLDSRHHNFVKCGPVSWSIIIKFLHNVNKSWIKLNWLLVAGRYMPKLLNWRFWTMLKLGEVLWPSQNCQRHWEDINYDVIVSQVLYLSSAIAV